MTTRRSFLALSASVFGSMALPVRLWAQRLGGDVFTNASVGPYQQGSITQQHFEALLGQRFRVFLEDDVVASLRLRKVTSLPAQVLSQRAVAALAQSVENARAGVQMSLGHRTELVCYQTHFDIDGPSFAQDSYLLEHNSLGRFAVLLVPGKPGVCSATFTSFEQVTSATATPVGSPVSHPVASPTASPVAAPTSFAGSVDLN